MKASSKMGKEKAPEEKTGGGKGEKESNLRSSNSSSSSSKDDSSSKQSGSGTVPKRRVSYDYKAPNERGKKTSRTKSSAAASDTSIRFKTGFRNTVFDCMKGRGWKHVESEYDWDVNWCDREWMFEKYDTLHLEPWQRVCHFRNDRELCRKDVSSLCGGGTSDGCSASVLDLFKPCLPQLTPHLRTHTSRPNSASDQERKT